MRARALFACLPALLAAALCAGCAGGAAPEELKDASGEADIPREIWGAMDDETRSALSEGPRYAALTFDDGPKAGTTGPLLDGLRERGAAATFFVIGEQIEGNEDLIRRMAAEGHQIGNHTYSHVRLLDTDRDAVVEEIHKTEVLLDDLLGDGDYWLRPPYGYIDSSRAALVGTPMVYWSLDPQDWKWLNSDRVTEYVVENIRPGDVVLLHDFYPTSVDAALRIIDALQEEGYCFVTVEELFRIQGVEPEDGVLYANPQKTRPLEG